MASHPIKSINLPELFRSVPGVDVMAVSVTDYNVSPRGLNTLGVANMLVLLAGEISRQIFKIRRRLFSGLNVSC